MRDRVLSRWAAGCVVVMLLGTGCKSKQDVAIETAKQAAAVTGQPQQIVSVDKNGATTTTTVAPPAPGRTGQTVTTTVTQAVVATTAPPPPVLADGEPVKRPVDLRIPAGTTLMVRINQHIGVKTTHAGDRFDGEIVEAIVNAAGRELVAKGTSVTGLVDASHRRGHFRGSSVLELRLITMTMDGTQYRLETHDLTRRKGGKGQRTGGLIGGGTGLGMLIGGVATGGVGLLVGGLAGAGAGTAAAGLTGNGDLEIPAESIVRFKLAQDLVVLP